jgi:RNA recognition motif-containing protein
MRPVPFKGNVIVTNLPEDMTAPKLADLFEEYGIVIGVEIRQIPANSGQATIGVVALAPDGAVDKAISAIDKTMLGKRKIKVGRAKPPAPKAKGARPAAAPASPKPVAGPPPVPRPFVAEALDGKMVAPPTKTARTVVIEYKNRRIIRP